MEAAGGSEKDSVRREFNAADLSEADYSGD